MRAILQQRLQIADTTLQRLYQRARFVFRARRYSKVFWPVVVADAVDVVDDLVTFERASDGSLHDNAVLEMRPPCDRQHHVSAAVLPAPAAPVGVARPALASVVRARTAGDSSATEPVKNGLGCETNRATNHGGGFARAIALDQLFGSDRLLVRRGHAAIFGSKRTSGLDQSHANTARGHWYAVGDFLKAKSGFVHRYEISGVDGSAWVGALHG